MRKNPERLAWLVLLLSFALCALSATAIPAGAKRLLDEHTSARSARLDIVYGTVLVRRTGTTAEQGAQNGMAVEPGDTIRTAGDARAILWLFDDSNVELGPDSSLTIRESLSSTFSNQLSEIALYLADGKPSVNVALPSTLERRFRVDTPMGSFALDEGSYELDLSRPNSGEVVVRVGRALVSHLGTTVTSKTGQRVELKIGAPPNGPLSLARNLVQDPEFVLSRSPEQPLGPFWRGDERDTEGEKGTVEVVEDLNGNYLRFFRQGKGHGENYAVQSLNLDVSQFRSLRLLLDVRLINQTLGGGGVAGTEYPLHVRLVYRDARREGRYEVGFYYQNPENHPTSSGSLVGILKPHGEWFTFEKDLLELDPRPTELIYVEIAASGWDYESHARNLRIMAE